MKFSIIMIATGAVTILASSVALAKSQPEKNNFYGFKIAVITGTAGSENILSGAYQNGIEDISAHYEQGTLKTTKAQKYDYEYELGLCVANLKISQLAKAEQSCTNAITMLPKLVKRSHKGKYLLSIAYSNRGVVRYLANNPQGALSDFNEAMDINTNEVVEQNLALLTSNLARYATNKGAATIGFQSNEAPADHTSTYKTSAYKTSTYKASTSE